MLVLVVNKRNNEPQPQQGQSHPIPPWSQTFLVKDLRTGTESPEAGVEAKASCPAVDITPGWEMLHCDLMKHC